MKRKRLKWLFLLLLFSGILIAVYYLWISLPVMTGYSAKVMCSCHFITRRSIEQIKKEELGFSPVNLASTIVSYKDSSVTSSVWGLAKQKAIYRHGLGCTLINGMTEAQIRAQSYSVSYPETNKETCIWPDGNRFAPMFTNSLLQEKLKEAIQNAFVEHDPKNPVRTRAVVVVYDGKLMQEAYAPEFDAHSKLMGWSMAKSVMNALTGILVKQGKLDIELPASVPEWKAPQDPRNKILLKHLLQQTSGLQFKEAHGASNDATNMLFNQGDMAAYSASLPLKYKPGEVFYYSSGNTNILSRIIRHTQPDSQYHSFPFRALFQKIGMNSVVIEPDASGTYVGSSYMFATARDWARFGLLYYYDGVWNGERILPEGWVKKTTSRGPSQDAVQYGYQFWLNAGKPGEVVKRPLPDAPADLYYADGYEGQEIYIIPSRKLVVVRLGLSHDTKFDENKFLKQVLAAFSQ